jgi:hypothetical protein
MLHTEPRTTSAPAASGSAREEHRRALERLERKQRVIADLIDGRLRLLEAAARFRDVQKAAPEDGERLCRAVIGWVYLALSDRPERAEALASALERELQTIVSRQGAVRLP